MEDNREKKPSRKENPFWEWLSDNLRYILLILVIAAVAAAVIFGVRVISENMGGGDSVSSSQTGGNTENDDTPESTPTPDAEGTDTPTPTPDATDTPAPTPTPEASLAAAPDEVSAVVTGYFQALAGQDADTLAAFVDELSDEDRAAVENNQRIEAYSNMEVYTYPGEAADSYVAFAVYDYKYAGYDTVLPGLTQLYVYRMEDGELRIAANPDESVNSYIGTILEQEDVQALITETQAAYNAVLDGNADLKAYVEGLS